jgi:hypothetical protein
MLLTLFFLTCEIPQSGFEEGCAAGSYSHWLEFRLHGLYHPAAAAKYSHFVLLCFFACFLSVVLPTLIQPRLSDSHGCRLL